MKDIEKVIEKIIEKSFANGIQVGVIQTLRELGIHEERLSESQAHGIYGKKFIEQWRAKRLIVAYPTGNEKRSKFYYLRSECETAKRTISMYNIIPPTIFKQITEKKGII